MMDILYVALGGSIGAMVRYGVTFAITRRGRSSTIATWLVNMIGTFILGWIVGMKLDSMYVLLLGVGFTGGLTTFSTFTLEIIRMSPASFAACIRYLLASILGGWCFAWLGWAIASLIIR